MAENIASSAAARLSFPDELILMLLNEKNGYFYQVPGWDLNCAVVGAVIAELSFLSRIDMDMELMHLLDDSETGDPVLDPFLKKIADESVQQNVQYWIEKLAIDADLIVDMTLERLVSLKILEHHDGDYWTLAPTKRQEDTASQFIKTRVSEIIFTDTIPDPRDVIIICLVNTCDVFRFIFELDEKAEQRIEFISKMDLLGHSIASAVEHTIATPLLRRSHLSKKIPTVSPFRLLLNRNMRHGNVPAVFADLAKSYGPVFQIRRPFSEPLIFLAGLETNSWVHRHGRMHLRVREYFADFEQVYGAVGVLPSLDGGDHFRLRRALSPAYSRKRLAGQLDQVYHYDRKFMAGWTVGEAYPATQMCRLMMNEQLSPLFVTVNTQDIIEDLIVFKERALTVLIMKALPKFMLKTFKMKRKAKKIDELIKRVQSAHTPAQRAGCPRNLADDLLSLHGSDPQLVPETNLRFAFSAALIASVYLGDALSFVVYAMASQPEYYERIRKEADELFDNGDPKHEDFNTANIDVTRRFIMECLRMYPIVPVSIRNVMNSCVVEDYELPVGSRIYIAQTATHYMEDHFKNPYEFDIDRYLPPRNEQNSRGYVPYGLGTHVCLGTRWMNLQLAVNLLLIAHHFTLKVSPENYELRFNPLPSMKPSKKLKFLIAEQHRELPASSS